jgi:hypothetical protein
MGLSVLAADAARRILEVVHYTNFFRHNLVKSGTISVNDWHQGAEVFSFTKPVEIYYTSRLAASTGPFGKTFTIDLFKNLSAYVHANPTKWRQAREGLEVKPAPQEIATAEKQMTDAAKAITLRHSS